MPTIRIKRLHHDADAYRMFKVYIDGVRELKIGDEMQKTIELIPGKHRLFIKSEGCKSEEISFHISEHESKTFEIKGNMAWIKYIIAFVVAFAVPSLLFERKSFLDFVYYFLIFIPVFILVRCALYYKNNYISIREIENI